MKYVPASFARSLIRSFIHSFVCSLICPSACHCVEPVALSQLRLMKSDSLCMSFMSSYRLQYYNCLACFSTNHINPINPTHCIEIQFLINTHCWVKNWAAVNQTIQLAAVQSFTQQFSYIAVIYFMFIICEPIWQNEIWYYGKRRK